MKGTPGEKCLELFFLTQVPLLLSLLKLAVAQSSDSSVSSQSMSGGKCYNRCSILCQILSVRK